MKYIKRILFDEIKKWIGRREIIAIRGPRQSGKTTLLKMLSEWIIAEKKVDPKHVIYVTFEDREELDSFSQNPKDFTARHISGPGKHYLLIDEAQYCKDLGQKLKLVYDLFDDLKIIITGSSSLELKNQTGKFLVGRLLEFELMPLTFYEYLSHADIGLAEMYHQWNEKIISSVSVGKALSVKKAAEIFNDELLKHLNNFMKFGGYPAVVAARNEEEKVILLKNLINTYLDRDILSFLQITDTIKFRKLMTLLAASDGSLIKIEKFANEIGSYFVELTKLLDALEQTYVIRRIGPYYKNKVTELRKAQKTYFVDTGLRNLLVENFSGLEKRPDAGALVENFVLNELYPYCTLRFWRTTMKSEVDFVAEHKQPLPIDVKFQHYSKPELTKSMYGFLDAYKPKECIVITKDFWGERRVAGSKITFVPVVYL